MVIFLGKIPIKKKKIEALPISYFYMNIEHKLQLVPFPATAVIKHSDQ